MFLTMCHRKLPALTSKTQYPCSTNTREEETVLTGSFPSTLAKREKSWQPSNKRDARSIACTSRSGSLK